MKAGLEKGGKRREDLHVNLAFFVAHGFGAEVRRLHEVVDRGENPATLALVPDEMVRTFALCGSPDEVRKQVERAWTVADSLWLAPPAWGLGPEKLAFYDQMIARTFYE